MCHFGIDYGICPKTYRPRDFDGLPFSGGTVRFAPISTTIPSYALDWHHYCVQFLTKTLPTSAHSQ